MKKVKFTVSYIMKEILEEDKKHFNLEIGGICNRLIEYYSDKEIDRIELKSDKNSAVQFNLNKANDEMYDKILEENKVQNESEFIRNIIFTYINNPRYKREEIVFKEKHDNIQKAIENKKKIIIKYHNDLRTVNPYFIKAADGENRLYLFCFCEKYNNYRCYRISDIQSVKISKNPVEIRDRRYIEGIKENFDPFRSYGKKVKVRFTEKGEKLLERVLNNRPKIIEKDEEKKEYLFECDEKLAQVYFPQFFSEMEIVEPTELRKWFKNKFEKTYKIYLKGDQL